MVDATNYWIAWAAYCTAATVYYLAFWRITRFPHRRVLKYCLRAVMLAVIATPWYVSDTGSVMAPALIVVLMDAITISSRICPSVSFNRVIAGGGAGYAADQEREVPPAGPVVLTCIIDLALGRIQR